MATIGQQLLQPEEGWKRYDDSVGYIKYEGTWQRNMPNASSWLGTRHISSNTPDKIIKFVFKGTKLRILCNSSSNRSMNATITIDGEVETINFRHTSTLPISPTRLAYEKTGLSNDYHTVIIRDNTTDYIDIDCIDVDYDGEIVRYDYLENKDLPELLKKYGTTWLGFDEPSGNTTDLLGGEFIGTNSGGVRGEGWNGEGYSLQLNGAQYMTVQNTTRNMIPNGDFSIRFKVRFRNFTTAQRIISTALGGRYSGLIIAVDGGNHLAVYNCVGSSITELGRYTGLIINTWYDFVISFGDDFRIIVNEEIEIINKIRPTFNHYTVAHIGVEPGNSLRFTGDIDDVQVFGKPLKLEDLKIKSTQIETKDGKFITLPNKDGRVMELPNNRADLGYFWKEIDNAVDKPGIMLTTPTTEYEKLGDNSYELGNGKVFSLPISDFKKVKVENNG